MDKKNCKICFMSGVIARSGGTERVSSIIANSLCERGYDVIFLSCWNHGAPHFELDKRISVFYLLDPKTEGKLYRTYLYPVIKLHSFIKKQKVDVLIDIDTELSIYSAFAKWGTSCKLVSWEHFNYWTMLRLAEKKRFWAKNLIKKYASKLVVLTDEDRNAHISELQFQGNMIMTIPNPCMANVNSNYSFESHTFLSVGRLAHEKGYDLLLNAWKIVEEHVPEWRCIIVGGGQDEHQLQEMSRKLNLERLIFAGQSNCVEEYYREAACYVLPSRYEGFPMVILEAESFGLPVIAFDCKTGPSELVVNNKNGYLIPDGNVAVLAEMMIEFTKDKRLAYSMSNFTKDYVRKFNLEAVTNRWESLIDSL